MATRRPKYDYREQWARFTVRLGSLVTLDELAPELLAVVIEAADATAGVLYLVNPAEGRYEAAAAVGTPRPSQTIAGDHSLVARLGTRPARLPMGKGATARLELPEAGALAGASVIAPLRWRDQLTGFVLLAPPSSGARYIDEDLELLATVAQQAAALVVSARRADSLARSRAFEAFHRLTSFVIHDVKNSIAALSMVSENALKNADDPDFQRDALKTVARTVDRMKALLDRLGGAPGPTRLRPELVDLASLARDATAPVVRSDRISLVQELTPLRVAADGEALSRVIQNLLANAMQSIDGAGTVTLRTFAENGHAVISVADTGCGMSDDFVRDSLFAPFRSTKKDGWGIGLYQAKRLVEAHRGTIEVASRQGIGTTFTVKLPIGGGQV
jgi:putative PEP-CTERM system histidine kinase